MTTGCWQLAAAAAGGRTSSQSVEDWWRWKGENCTTLHRVPKNCI